MQRQGCQWQQNCEQCDAAELQGAAELIEGQVSQVRQPVAVANWTKRMFQTKGVMSVIRTL